MKTTITEALSEINLIKKKIDSNKETITNNLTRVKHVKDPFESDGGTANLIKQKIQSIASLFVRLEKIKGAIAQANLMNEITIGENTKTIFDWLTWKRDISKDHLAFLNQISANVTNQIASNSRNPQVFKDESGNTQLVEVISNVDLSDILRKREIMTEQIEKLDGQLSLKNATIMIEV